MLTVGVDVGNSDIKTQNCTLTSGYKAYNTCPELAKNVMFFKDKYYVLDITKRMPYKVDKTINEQCFILTLFGIAEEILYNAKLQDKKNVQVEIDKIRHIKLGVGLPPGHMDRYKKPLEKYYLDNMKDGVEFEYKGYKFKFVVDKIRVFPQDFVAVYGDKNCETAQKKSYYIIGIGGGTTDVIPVMDKVPDTNGCFSLEEGTRIMFSHISEDVQKQFGEMLDENLIEDVLRGEDTIIPDDIQAVIKNGATLHFENTINNCIQHGVKLNLYPVVFIGGGGILLENLIKESPMLKKTEILKDVRANAKAYAKYIDA